MTIAGSSLIAFLSGCSTYNADARAARNKPVVAGSPEGLWVGRWYEKDKPKHGGDLKWVMTRTGDMLYRAASRSRWRGIFTAKYDTTVVVTPIAPGAFMVRGDHDIWPFGTYSITGRVDETHFRGTYEIAGHPGVVELTRPADQTSNTNQP